MLAVLENAFMFLADLVRAVEVPVVCQFIKPRYSHGASGSDIMEIFFSHEPDIRGQHILLVEGLVHSGVTSEFLMSDLRSRGAASVKLVTLLDRQSARRVPLQPDYFGFLVDETFLVGYGLGSGGADGPKFALFGGGKPQSTSDLSYTRTNLSFYLGKGRIRRPGFRQSKSVPGHLMPVGVS